MDEKEQVNTKDKEINTKDEEIDTKNEEVDTKVKKEYIMTEARTENLRKARLKATLLREQLKQKKMNMPVEAKPKTKMEKKLEALEAKTKAVVKVNDTDIKSEDEPSTSEMETTTQVESNDKAAEDAKPHKPIEPVAKAEAPKAQVVKPEPPKPNFRREGGFLYM
jgi:hypothetical protein